MTGCSSPLEGVVSSLCGKKGRFLSITNTKHWVGGWGYFITVGNTTSDDFTSYCTVLTVHGWRNQAVLGSPLRSVWILIYGGDQTALCQVVYYVHLVLYKNCSRKEQSCTHPQL